MLIRSTPLKYQADLARWSVCGSTYCTSTTSINRHTDNWIIKCCLVVCPFLSLFLFTSVVSATRINLAFFTHIEARRMHPSCIWDSFIHLILPFRAAGWHRISPQLPCSHIDFRSRLNYFGVRPITQVPHLAVFDHVSSSLCPPPHTHTHTHTQTQTQTHTLLTFCCSCCSVASTCIWVSLLFASIFDSGFLSHTSACRMCVNVWGGDERTGTHDE